MTIFIVLFLVLFLILIFQVIKLLSFAIKKKELSKEVKKTLIVFLCSLFAFILVGITVPESTKNAIKKEEELKKKDKEAKEAKKKAEKEKRQAESAKKKENNCVLGIFCEEEENKVSQDELKYEVLKNQLDGENKNGKRGYLAILVKDNINEPTLKEVMIKAAKDHIKDYDILYVFAYGDKKFWKLDSGATHGMLIYNKKDGVTESNFGAKSEIPTDKEKDIYIEYVMLLKTSKLLKPDMTEKEKKELEKEAEIRTAVKNGISPEKMEEIYSKIIFSYQTY